MSDWYDRVGGNAAAWGGPRGLMDYFTPDQIAKMRAAESAKAKAALDAMKSKERAQQDAQATPAQKAAQAAAAQAAKGASSMPQVGADGKLSKSAKLEGMELSKDSNPWFATQTGTYQGGILYNPDQSPQFTEWDKMTAPERTALKKTLYYAGMYGNSYVDFDGGTLSMDDRNALARAMDLANSSGGLTYMDAIKHRAEAGEAAGRPFLGAKGDGSDINTPSEAEVRAAQSKWYTQIEEFEQRNGVPFGDNYKNKSFERIIRGESDEATELRRMRETAATAWPAFAEQIKGGVDVMDAASPYIQTMSRILEVPDAKVDLHDPTIRSALQSTGDKGQPIPLYEFENRLRQDSRWQYTDNAQQQMAQYAQAIKGLFGG